ncbi:MAG: hypothetical protein NTX64_15380 [Elusimicrobia bacterium]|nr:hypothetical protein [Elusimicrobiota bacterium]
MPTLSGAPAGAQARRATLFVGGAGLLHALVDTSTVLAVCAASHPSLHGLTPADKFYFVLAYDALAFAGQAPLALAVDRWRLYRPVAAAGLGLSALSLVFIGIDPIATLLLAGAGNAAFHVAAGALSLQARPGRAAPPGIFVAPGALGLWLGSALGKGGGFLLWNSAARPLAAVLALASLAASFAPLPAVEPRPAPRDAAIPSPALCLCLLLFSVSVRSFVGCTGGRALPPGAAVSLMIACAGFAGKTLGGVLSGRLGWIATTVTALLASAPLIAFGGVHPYAVSAGMLLLQATMPVTLVAVSSILPGRPALSFGLACLALAAGAAPAFFPWAREHCSSTAFLTLILVSAAATYGALRLLRGVPMRFPAGPQPI